MIFAGLVGAILWNLTTWLFGLPSSSSHALFGGLIGAVWWARASGVNFSVVEKIIIPAVVSPLVAGAAGLATFLPTGVTAKGREARGGGFRLGQIASASLVSLAHGTSDGQKTMGVITLMLISAGARSRDRPPVWVIGAAGLAIGLGTYSGGWRIIRTMGKGLSTSRRPGFCRQHQLGGRHPRLLAHRLRAVDHAGLLRLDPGFGGGQGRKRPLDDRPQDGFAWLLTLPAAAVVGGPPRPSR